LLSVNVFVLVVPALAVVFLRLYDTHLIQRTEGELVAEAVVIGEAWRDHWLAAQGFHPEEAPAIRPPDAGDERYFPIEARLDLGEGLLPAPMPPPTRQATDRSGPAWQAGRAVTPLLLRTQLANLAGARVLDAEGCIVATTGDDLGACIDNLPEVAQALYGSYAAVARERISDEPPPPLSSISRRGHVRVFVALPIFSEGNVVAVVRLARTALDPLKSLWLQGDTLLLALLLCLSLTVVLSLFLSFAITRPVRAITAAATAVARGEARPLGVRGIAPAEVHALGEALVRMTAQLRDRADYISDFAATVSHELKTPLAAIRGATELLRDSWREMGDDDRQRFIANIDADAARMQHLATRLLELARIQSAPDASEEVDLPSFFRELTQRYGEQVRLDLASAPARLNINRDHLDAAVRNLLDNAVRHGAGRPVEVDVTARGSRLEIKVRDHGSGISPANAGRIFEKFFTTERDRGGTGLGLAITQAVAETRRGSVRFETGPAGTTFVLTL
jgi:signal transduction histidine kinase